MPDTAPFVQKLETISPAFATDAEGSSPAMEAPFAGTISAVTYTPEAAITGVDTNTRRLELINRGQAGAGTTVVATLQFDDGVDGVANDEKALALSGTAANLVVAAGDILELVSTAPGTGLADPGGRVQVTISRS